MNRTAPGAWNILAALTLARIAFGFQLQTVASLGPDLVAAFQLDFARLGTLMGLYMAPGVLVALPCGFLARRFGDFAVVTIGLAMMVLGALLAGFADGPLLIGAGRALAGCGAVAMTVLQGKILADRFAGPRFTLVMGMLVGAFPIGIGLAQVIQPRLSHAFGWPAAFLAGAVVAAAATLWFALSWRPLAAGPRTLAWPSRREMGLVIVAGLIWTAYNAAYFNFLAYMPSFLAVRGHPVWVADAVMMVATWGNLPAILLGGALALRFGPTRVFLAGTLLCVISVAGPAVLDVPLLWGVIFGTVASMHGGLIVQLGTLSCRPENRAVGMGLFYTTYYAGGTWLPALCGAAADRLGDPSGAFLAAAGLSLLAVPFYFLHRRWSEK
jgi:MFS family permease